MNTSILAAVLLLSSSAHAQLSKIGAAAAVRGRVEALSPVSGAVGRVMESGKEVYLRDTVTTDAQGRMQVLLLDETVFTIGPNSSMVLDEFVYDPATGAGKMTARVTKGVFRFVTGKIARETPSNMKVKLPVGVIGIRGTIVAGKADPKQSMAMLMGPGPRNNADEKPGAFEANTPQGKTEVTRTGYGSTMEPGKAPSPAFLVPQNMVDEITGGLAPKSDEPPSKGGGGGAASSSEGSASKESGQETAGALGDLSNTQSLSEASEESAVLTQNASQSSLASLSNGTAQWSDLVNFGSGVGHFDQTISGAVKCTGGGCGGGWMEPLTVCLYIDFASRSIRDMSYLFIGGSYISDSVDITPAFSYAGQSGSAVFTFAPGNNNNSNFTGTKLTFINSGGLPAKNMQVDMSYFDGTLTGSGASTFTR